MTGSEEMRRATLQYLLDKVKPGEPISQADWDVAYKYIRADQIIATIDWKIKHIFKEAL